MRRVLVSLEVLLLLLAFSAGAQPSIVILSGKVFTGDPARPFVEAVAIEGNRITAVGTTPEIKALARDKTRVIDAKGRVVIPGINDAHVHAGMATDLMSIDRGIDPNRSDIESAIANVVDESPADLWIVATIGPDVLLDPRVNAESLEALAHGRKIVLSAFAGHGAILSKAAMTALGVAGDASDPRGGWFGRDASGRVDGRVFEYAHYPLVRRMADMASEQDLVDSIRLLSDEALGYGITSIQAMPAGSEPKFIAALARANVPLRVRVIDFLDHADSRTDAVKWILDGTPLERNAALRTAKYAAGGQGRENFSDLTALVRDAGQRQLLVHAVGDKTVESALNAFANAASPLQRPRLEHADGLQRDLFPLALRTGAVVVQNPAHFQFRNRFPAGDYMLVQSLLKAGIPLALGSDGPLNPYLNIMFATDNGDESLTREEAVRAYTSGSAFAEMKEKQKGTIAPGMLADLAVLSQDIFKVRASELPDTKSVLTMIDGRIVYSELP
jgi:predicted amidohydrolase YtcJ